jgi:hypothetical protein
MHLVRSSEQFDAAWPDTANVESDDRFINAAVYRPGCLPINVGAVVWKDGVTVHYPSIQLIGIEPLTNRPFGFCGSDFALASQLGGDVLDRIEGDTRRIGEWMRANGFLGAFGVDYLLDPRTAELVFTEINPRFQGSTRLSCRLSVDAGEPCILLDHISAFLGLECAPREPLRRRMAGVHPRSQLIIHNVAGRCLEPDMAQLQAAVVREVSPCEVEVAARPGIVCEPGAVVANVVVEKAVTNDGYSLVAPFRNLINVQERAGAQAMD